MKMKGLLFLLCAASLTACTIEDQSRTILTGFFPNTMDSQVVLYVNDVPVDTTNLDKDKNFRFSLKIDQGKLYNFRIGGKYQYVYLEPNDSVAVYANALDFSESISFSGKGSAVNNFMHSQAILAIKQSDLFRGYHSLLPFQYQKVMDSICQERRDEYNTFVLANPSLTAKAKDLALVSATFPIYKEMEIYPFVYQSKNGMPIVELLPAHFYDYRKQINYNDTFLEYFRPYYSYMVMYVNNLAYTKYSTDVNTLVDVNREQRFHLEKIQIINNLFKEGALRDNLFRNAAYSYIFNVRDQRNYKMYFDVFRLYNAQNTHKVELERVFRNAIALQAGKVPPDFDLIDRRGERTKFSAIQKPELTIYYFWSANQKELSDLIFNRVAQLKNLYPNVMFVGIDIGEDKARWRRHLLEDTLARDEQYHSVDFMDLSQKFLINNINKSLILDKNGRIISAFEDIFSPDLEKLLPLKES